MIRLNFFVFEIGIGLQGKSACFVTSNHFFCIIEFPHLGTLRSIRLDFTTGNRRVSLSRSAQIYKLPFVASLQPKEVNN